MKGKVVKLTVTGKLAVFVWRRGRWTSMPHLISQESGSVTGTHCGHKVELYDRNVDGIAMTWISAKDFYAIGCGACRNATIRDWHKQLLNDDPDARTRFRNSLAKLKWMT